MNSLLFSAAARQPHGRSQRGRSKRGECIAWVACFRLPSIALQTCFFDKLRRRGFIEGQNLTVEYRAYGQHVDLIPQYAPELVMARVDVIVTAGDEQFAPCNRRRKPFRSLRS